TRGSESFGYHLTICSGYYTSHESNSKNAPNKNHLWFARQILNDIKPIAESLRLRSFTLIGSKGGRYGDYDWTEEFIQNYNYITQSTLLANTQIELRLPIDDKGNHIADDVHAKIILLSIENGNGKISDVCAFV